MSDTPSASSASSSTPSSSASSAASSTPSSSASSAASSAPSSTPSPSPTQAPDLSSVRIVHQEHGSDGSVVTHYEDGSKTIANPQGYMTYHKDGKVIQFNPDDSTSQYNE
jgi:hypothetical protein